MSDLIRNLETLMELRPTIGLRRALEYAAVYHKLNPELG